MEGAGDDAPLAHVRYASNFARNLESIEAFWIENGFPEGYDRLLDELTEVVVPNLQRHPGMGRPFMSRAVDSVEGERLVERIALRLSALDQNAQVREYVMDDYLVLYVVAEDGANKPGIVHLLAIKHQRQLGFDVGSLD